ncbi:hypothetical protein [Streptomyces sp. NPDC046832]|uniref:hypothetical protein n=1 Tax=Streptomyces sp. NPDC046832 TaxID=3155020 RepID=UPI0033BFE1DB
MRDTDSVSAFLSRTARPAALDEGCGTSARGGPARQVPDGAEFAGAAAPHRVAGNSPSGAAGFTVSAPRAGRYGRRGGAAGLAVWVAGGMVAGEVVDEGR